MNEQTFGVNFNEYQAKCAIDVTRIEKTQMQIKCVQIPTNDFPVEWKHQLSK